MSERSGSDDPQSWLTAALKAAGWSREAAAETFDWPDFQFNNGSACIEVFLPPGEDWLRIGLITDDQEGYLKVPFGDRLDGLLQTLIGSQRDLDAETWEHFIDQLLAVPLRVFAATGEDGDDLVELL